MLQDGLCGLVDAGPNPLHVSGIPPSTVPLGAIANVTVTGALNHSLGSAQHSDLDFEQTYEGPSGMERYGLLGNMLECLVEVSWDVSVSRKGARLVTMNLQFKKTGVLLAAVVVFLALCVHDRRLVRAIFRRLQAARRSTESVGVVDGGVVAASRFDQNGLSLAPPPPPTALSIK